MPKGKEILYDGNQKVESPAVLLGIKKRKQKRKIKLDLGPLNLLTMTPV